MTSRRNVLFTFAVLACAAVVLVSQANAATVQRNITFNTNSAGTFFSADLTATGTLVMSSNATVSLSLGSILSISPQVIIPAQTFAINQNTTLNATPNGTMTLELPDTTETFGGAFPSLAGALTEADVPQLDVTLIGSTGVNILNLTPSLTGSTTIDILGITTLDFPLVANLTVDALLKDIVYSQVGNALIGPGTVTNPGGPGSPPGSITTAYEIPGPLAGGVISGGTASLGAEAIVGGDINVDLGIFGSFGQTLAPTSVFDDTIPIDVFALLFDMFLTDLDPALFGAPRDVNVDLDGNFDLAGPLSFDFVNAGTTPIPATNFDTSLNLGIFGSVNIDGVISGSFTYSLDAEITLSNLQYGFESDEVDLLVPEPSSIMLVVMGLVALMPVVALRRRKS